MITQVLKTPPPPIFIGLREQHYKKYTVPTYLLEQPIGNQIPTNLYQQRLWEQPVVKGDIQNEKIRLPPLEVHFGVGGCDRTDSARRAGQE